MRTPAQAMARSAAQLFRAAAQAQLGRASALIAARRCGQLTARRRRLSLVQIRRLQGDSTARLRPKRPGRDRSPPTATAKRRAPPTTAKGAPPPQSAKDTPPTAASKRSAQPAAAEGGPPTPADNISSRPAIAKPPPSPEPAADYDGFTVGIDDGDTSGQTTRPVRPRPARRPKLGRESDRIEGQQPANQAEDENLNRKLTICRGCKE
jgi:hypothetical protein